MSIAIKKKKEFIVINTFFACQNCGEFNPLLKGSCRNHCRKCLYSMHLDENGPGDRKSLCKALMKPIELEYKGKKGFIIHHQCLTCGIIRKNKIAGDDDWDKIIQISKFKNQN